MKLHHNNDRSDALNWIQKSFFITITEQITLSALTDVDVYVMAGNIVSTVYNTHAEFKNE